MSESFEKWKATYNCDEDTIQGYNIRDMQAAYTAGVQAERERCAKVAEQKAGHVGYPIDCCQEDYENYLIGLDIAAAIRKGRGNA